jgi:hypothetical protein
MTHAPDDEVHFRFEPRDRGVAVDDGLHRLLGVVA